MSKKVLFIDRDGTIVREPADFQVDRLDKISFLPYVISSLATLQAAGYELVMVTNQDGMGTKIFPKAAFDAAQQKILEVLAGEGVTFSEIFIDTHFPHNNSPMRKPEIGMLLPYLKKTKIDFENSYVIGDRKTDAQLAANLGINSITIHDKKSAPGDRQYKEGGLKVKTSLAADWKQVTSLILKAKRTAHIVRKTKETDIDVSLTLDGKGRYRIRTGLRFFDHMLEQLSKHSGIDLSVRVKGDLDVDEHHTVEDTAIAMGEAFKKALGDKRGIARYGFVLPMDEALATCAIDCSGRPYLVFKTKFKRDRVGELPTELVSHFFQSFAEHAGVNLYLKVEGDNDHHKIEASFKALAKCLQSAIRREGTALPSTKGTL